MRVICSGEALPLDLTERFLGRLGAQLHNLYGPTEAAVDVTYWACRRAEGLSSVSDRSWDLQHGVCTFWTAGSAGACWCVG